MPGMLAHVGQVHRVDAVGDLAGAAQVLPLDTSGGGAAFSWPVSSSAPITSPPRRPGHRAACPSPATANRRTTAIAAAVSHTARLSSRCVLSGDRSPACPAIVQPLRRASPPASAHRYFPACSHGPVLAKQGRSSASISPRSRAASRAPILTAAAASDFVVLTNHMIARRLPREQLTATQISQGHPSSRTEWPLSY